MVASKREGDRQCLFALCVALVCVRATIENEINILSAIWCDLEMWVLEGRRTEIEWEENGNRPHCCVDDPCNT